MLWKRAVAKTSTLFEISDFQCPIKKPSSTFVSADSKNDFLGARIGPPAGKTSKRHLASYLDLTHVGIRLECQGVLGSGMLSPSLGKRKLDLKPVRIQTLFGDFALQFAAEKQLRGVNEVFHRLLNCLALGLDARIFAHVGVIPTFFAFLENDCELVHARLRALLADDLRAESIRKQAWFDASTATAIRMASKRQ
jgi:hypothetical protein